MVGVGIRTGIGNILFGVDSGSESCLGLAESNSEGCPSRDDHRIITHGFIRKEQKRNALKDKGTILKFLKSCNPSCSSPKTKNVDMNPGSEADVAELGKESPFPEYGMSDDRHSLNQDVRTKSWNYKIDEIDPSVINDLPPEIQDEVRAWLPPHKRSKIAKRGSPIAHYFSPTKTTQQK